jgi:hypothetical protein
VKEYKLKKAIPFTLDTAEWEMPLMQPGDFVGIEGSDVYIQDPKTEKWYKTIDMVSQPLMDNLEELYTE